VLRIIATQCLELGAESVRAQRIQELLDERVVEIFFADDNIVAYLLQRHKAEPKRRRNSGRTHASFCPPCPDFTRYVQVAGDNVVEPVHGRQRNTLSVQGML